MTYFLLLFQPLKGPSPPNSITDWGLILKFQADPSHRIGGMKTYPNKAVGRAWSMSWLWVCPTGLCFECLLSARVSFLKAMEVFRYGGLIGSNSSHWEQAFSGYASLYLWLSNTSQEKTLPCASAIGKSFSRIWLVIDQEVINVTCYQVSLTLPLLQFHRGSSCSGFSAISSKVFEQEDRSPSA